MENITPLIAKENNLRYLAVLAKHQLTKESSIISCTGKLDLIFFHSAILKMGVRVDTMSTFYLLL